MASSTMGKPSKFHARRLSTVHAPSKQTRLSPKTRARIGYLKLAGKDPMTIASQLGLSLISVLDALKIKP